MADHDTDKHPDAALIRRLGGAAKVARRLGFDAKTGTQRVHNWTERGIPELMRLRHPDIFADPGEPEGEGDSDQAEAA